MSDDKELTIPGKTLEKEDESRLIAVLDKSNFLVGTERREPREGDVVLEDGCDLATNGTYKWVSERGCFVPAGFGFPQAPAKPPVPFELVVYYVARAVGLENLPDEVRVWSKWYENHVKRRQEEALRRTKKGA